jgi:hypothetical protein
VFSGDRAVIRSESSAVFAAVCSGWATSRASRHRGRHSAVACAVIVAAVACAVVVVAVVVAAVCSGWATSRASRHRGRHSAVACAVVVVAAAVCSGCTGRKRCLLQEEVSQPQ